MSAFSEFLGSFTENKNVCILGFGREGKSTYRLLKDLSPASVTVCDLFLWTEMLIVCPMR